MHRVQRHQVELDEVKGKLDQSSLLYVEEKAAKEKYLNSLQVGYPSRFPCFLSRHSDRHVAAA